MHMLEEEADEFFAYGIENRESDSREQDWMVQVKINDIPIKFKIDTGA